MEGSGLRWHLNKWGKAMDTLDFTSILNKYGLEKEDAEKEGFLIENIKIEGMDIPSIKIPYDSVILPNYDNPYGIVRYRLLSPYVKEGKEQKYHQKGKGTYSRLSALYSRWDDLRKDPKIDLFITEGELKAAKACKEGFPCLAISGVTQWGIKRGKQRVLLSTINSLNLKNRRVYIVFDSDVTSNADVKRERFLLSNVLLEHNAIPYFITLKPIIIDNKTIKCGIDDYLIKYGAEAFSKLVKEAAPIQKYEDNAKLKSIMAWCPEEKLFYLHRRGKFITFSNKSDLLDTIAVDFNLTNKDEKESMINTWLSSPDRIEIRGKSLFAGKPIFYDGYANVYSNIFPELITKENPEEIEIDTSPFFNLLKTSLVEDEDYKRLLMWIAYPLVNIERPKLPNYCVLYSKTGGTGKSSVMATIKELYGEKGIKTSLSDISDKYNSYVLSYFAYCDEPLATKNDAQQLKNKLKDLTSESVSLRGMYQEPVDIRTITNYMFATNRLHEFSVDRDDRRAFVVAFKEIEKGSNGNELASKVYDIIVNEQNLERKKAARRHLFTQLVEFYHQYKNEIDVTRVDFAKFSKAKKEMEDLSSTSLEDIANYLINQDGLLDYLNNYFPNQDVHVPEIIEIGFICDILMEAYGHKTTRKLCIIALENAGAVRIPVRNNLTPQLQSKMSFIAIKHFSLYREIANDIKPIQLTNTILEEKFAVRPIQENERKTYGRV